MDALKYLLFDLCRHYGIPVENVLGHCETDSGKAQGKTCPDFDVAALRMWLKSRV
jgi:N-acetyl-anhydromuramyl-L-alanine amidase AmpD